MNMNVLYFMISYLATGVTLLGIAVVVYLKGRENKLNIIFSLYSFAIAWWSLFSIPMIISDNLRIALFWDRICLMGTVFIPTMFIHFIAVYLKLEEKYKFFIKMFYLCSFIFLILDATPYFVPTVEIKKHINYFTYPGIFYYIFVTYFTIVATFGILFIFNAYKKAPTKSLEKKRLFYLFWANAFGYFGGSLNYLLSFNICTSNIATIGNYLTTVYSIAIAYIIFRYRFLDIEFFIKKSIIFGGILTLALGTSAISTSFITQFIVGGQFISLAITVFIITLFFEPLEKWLARLTEKFLFQKEYDHQIIVKEISRGMVGKIELEELRGFISHALLEKMKLENVAIVDKDEPRQLKAAVSIPIFLRDEEYWILSLGEKKSGKVYSKEDKNMLEALSHEISIAIENAINFQELRRSQIELLRQENLKFVSVLVKGLAHEIFNPLTPLQHGIEDLEGEDFLKIYEIYENNKGKLDKDEELKFKEAILALRGSTKSLKANARHIQLIVDTLNKIEKGDDKTIGPVDIKTFLKEVVTVFGLEVEPDLQREVVVNQNIEKGLPPVNGNPTLLKQVFINLYKNACEAMKNSATKIVNISCQVNESNNNELLLEFSDTGAGIPAEILPKLFTYGATTKGAKGSGIGLHQCKAIIEKFGGFIKVESGRNRGTKFIIGLPAWVEEYKTPSP